jgi:CheY-like chemotaxis protein
MNFDNPVEKRILLIDDDDCIHLRFRNILPEAAKKYHPNFNLLIDSAVTPETALQKISQTSYDLCIMDYLLVSKIDPTETIHESIKACQAIVSSLIFFSPGSIVVVHTHYFESDQEAQDTCKFLGVSGCLNKSIESDAIWPQVKKLLSLPVIERA